jgi:FMN phosphatase YigB (HAD superfamily)
MMDINPSACLLIDDSPAKIGSAAASGIKGILYQNTDQTLEALEWISSGK